MFFHVFAPGDSETCHVSSGTQQNARIVTAGFSMPANLYLALENQNSDGEIPYRSAYR
jgi:hypothetical protein